jgi:hypothetical protein
MEHAKEAFEERKQKLIPRLRKQKKSKRICCPVFQLGNTT